MNDDFYKIRNLLELFRHFNYNEDDKLGHREVIKIYRVYEEALESKISQLIESYVVGSSSHNDAKNLRNTLNFIKSEFDDNYSLTKAYCVFPRPASKVSTERYFKYEYESGKVTVNFASLKIPTLPHFLVVFRTYTVTEDIKTLLSNENAISEIKNNDPLHMDTIKSIIGPEYDELQLSADLEIMEKQHPRYRPGEIISNAVLNFSTPEGFEIVPESYEDFPFNYGKLFQKSGGKLGAFFYCLANDYCRRKKTVIAVNNIHNEKNKQNYKSRLLLKEGFKKIQIKSQTVHDLDFTSIEQHLKEDHWTQLFQAGYVSTPN